MFEEKILWRTVLIEVFDKFSRNFGSRYALSGEIIKIIQSNPVTL